MTSTETPQTFTLAEQALNAIWMHLRDGDWGNAERVLNSYAADVNAPADACQVHGFQADDPRRGRLGICVACRHPADADCHPLTARPTPALTTA
jgi:hypothetical protein